MTEFKVTDYGAVPDGVTDSTAAFESALADAEKCHGTVLVPSGDYIVGKLRMGEGVALRGVSGWSFRDNGTATLHLRDSGCDCMIDMTGSLLPGIDGFSTRMNVGIVSLMRQCTAYAVRFSHNSDHWFGPVLAKHFFD